MTGASGAPYFRGLVDALLRRGARVHAIVSPSGGRILEQELGLRWDPSRPDLATLFPDAGPDRLRLHRHDDVAAPPSGGLYPTDAMVVCPCSAGRIGSFAAGLSQDLIDRAAAVTLKERRTLVVVPRETPLSLPTLRAMTALAEAGACILPAMPAHYTHPKTVEDMERFVVTKIVRQIGLPCAGGEASWGEGG
ncbi:MAG: UbiX family flavin prenyltransferase [Planctomycetes bacterium]|nr:UbiX family flavin prenyltransferase [Planctomycetota bacterium]